MTVDTLALRRLHATLGRYLRGTLLGLGPIADDDSVAALAVQLALAAHMLQASLSARVGHAEGAPEPPDQHGHEHAAEPSA